MWTDRANLPFFALFLFVSFLRLIGEISGYGNVLFKVMPLLCLSLSVGFLFTWQVVFNGLEVYSIIFVWMQEFLSRMLKNIVSCRWRSPDRISLVALCALAWPVRDMAVRWNIVRQRWGLDFPQYAQVFLHIAAVLYILFMVIQGLYLVAVMTSTEVVCKYSKKEQVKKYTWNLIIVNFCLLMHDALWIMTTLAIEGGENYLLKVWNLGCVGLVVYEVCALVALVNLQMAISYEPDSSIDVPDDPSKAITMLQNLIPVFFLLSIAREFHISSSFAVLLPVTFFAVGGIVIVLKMYLLQSYLAMPNFTSLLLDMHKGPAYKKITAGSAFIGVITIISLVVNLSQGYDSYRCWLSDESAAFRPFLAFYTTSYIALIGYEGFLAIWQLSYQDHTQYLREESTKRSLVNTVLSVCQETSVVFAIYHTVFVVYLPDAGLNYTTLARMCGPVLFHVTMLFAYLHLKEKCYRTPVQVSTGRGANKGSSKDRVVFRDRSVKAPKATKFPSSKTVNAPSSTPGASVYHSFLVLRHKINSAMSKYALSLDSLLVPLALLRLMLFGEVFAPFLPQWALTRCYWFAYILVCIHWLLVMHRELHSLTVIKKCYSSMFRIVFRGGIFKYPFNLCLGIVFFLVAALTILSIIFRASHSAHEWAGQRTVVLQIMVLPLLGIHAYAILLQGLLLYGAITATDAITEATENSEVPVFAESLPKLKYINLVLLLDHVIFMFLSNGTISALSEYPLLIFHMGSFASIWTLQRRGKELDKPRDEQNEPENNQSDPIAICILARWIPLHRTGLLMRFTACAAVVRLIVKIYTFQGDWVIIVLFRLLTSLTFAVVNYYICRSLTKQLARQHHLSLPNGKPTLILYITVGFFGIAEVVYAFYCQWTGEADGSVLMNTSLTIAALMNVALIIHEDILVIFLVSLDVEVEDKCCNLKQALELVLHLNIFYAGFGAFSSFLAWLVTDNGSLIHLLGHLTCAILVPTMASPVLERMHNDINKDLQSNEIATNQEEGRSEQVCNNPPPLAERFIRDLCRCATE